MADSLESAARARFVALLDRDPLPLDELALAVAAEEYPDLDPARYLTRLDALAARVVARAPPPARSAALLRALRDVLHGEVGLRGNAGDYYDPRNSFLNEVLDRGLGIPLTLSLVYVEVARRAGLPLQGIAFPGHFLARYASPSGAEVYVDAFAGGELLSAQEWLERHPGRGGDGAPGRSALRPASPRQILVRLLSNLHHVYRERRDDVRLFGVLDRLVLLQPDRIDTVRERGLAAARLGAAAPARRDLKAYLEAAARAPDREAIRGVLAGLRERGPLLN
jgi:regulator of sirC expression with transglutaminase-like and TPR domain